MMWSVEEEWAGCYPPGEPGRRKWMLPIAKGEEPHPAKMSFGLAERIFKEGVDRGWWGPGARMACPMAGEGTETIVWRLNGCDTYSIEIVPQYFERLVANHAALDSRLEPGPQWEAWMTDARGGWPRALGLIDVTLFSPTYEGAISKHDEGPYADGKAGKRKEEDRKRIEGYAKVDGQIGDMKGVEWRKAMQDIYWQAWQVTKPGGFLVTVTKDRRKHNQRYPICTFTTEDAMWAGWQPLAHFKALGAARSLFARVWNNRHAEAGRADLVVDSEDVLVFQKAGGTGLDIDQHQPTLARINQH